jgi:hypothetical protein
MEEQSSNFSPEQSLRIINDMIAAARNDYQHQSFYFLLWGWLLMLTGIGHFVLSATYPEYANWLWYVQGVAGGIISALFGPRKQSGRDSDTHLNRLVGNLWMAFGITLFFTIFASVYMHANPIPLVLFVTAVPTFVTGKMLRFTPLVWGGISFWISGIASLFVPAEYSTLVFSTGILLGYIEPGYLLRRTEKRKLSV